MNDQREDMKQILEKDLDIPSNSSYTFEPRIGTTSIGPDIRVEFKESVWYVEIKRKADWNSVSNLLLYRELGDKNAILVLAARVIPFTLRDQGNRIGIRFIQLPRSFVLDEKRTRTHGKVTSYRAWKVIYGLLSSNNRSIRNISLSENVSYGWSYQIINNLISQGIIERHGNHVVLKNRSGLFNAIAWERPFKKLEIETIVTDFTSTIELARTLSDSEYGKDLIFCGYLAATLHYGIGIRSDLIQGYLLDTDILDGIRSDYSANTKEGIKLHLHSPDRDVREDSVEISEIRVTSREQTVLDIAGLGYQGRDLLDNMVKEYGTDRR